MSYLYLDIEVVPNLTDEQIVEIEKSIEPPGNYKKPESIQKWKDDQGKSVLKEKVHKACFNELTGKIICIGAAQDGPVKMFNDNERDLLGEFSEFLFEEIESENGRMPTLVGHNAIAFDIPYIWRRCKVNNIILPFGYPGPSDMKPWMTTVEDTMVLWSGARDKISLDKLASGLGFESHKDKIDGSMVWSLYQEGKLKEIYDYCAMDVELTRSVHKRLK